MKRCFLDTNIIVYANDRGDPTRQQRAVSVVEALLRHQIGVISTQVMQEYANTALAKLKQNPSIILRQLAVLERLTVVAPSPDLVRRAVEIHLAHGASFWDAGIIAAAESAHCDVLLSEDFNSGQLYAGIRALNPLLSEFALDQLTA